MAKKSVDQYVLAWSDQTNRGRVELLLGGGETVKMAIGGSTEFIAVATILRESPLWYVEEGGILTTGPESVGD